MTAALEGGEWSAARPAALYPRERPGTHFTGSWVGPRAGLDGWKISSPPGFDPGRSGPEVSRKLRFPDFMITAQDSGKVVSLTYRPPLPPGNAPGTTFLLGAESTPGP